jgi:hypothetical protein
MGNNFEPHLIVRLMPAVYLREKLPRNAITDEASAVAHAGQRAKHHHRKVCLSFEELKTYWFNEQGLYFKVEA